MSKGLLGRKLGMTSLFTPEGQLIPVTVIEVGPCVVTQVKTEEKDGYNALQIGFGTRKATRTPKPLQGHFKKSGGNNYARLREFDVDNPADFSPGQAVSPEIFKVGERVDVVGTTKGRGFSGVIKRHGFSGGPSGHGSKCHRIPGSIGTSAWPSRVARGKKMPGHFGVDQFTTRNLEIVDVRPQENLILVRGPVPGHRDAFVMLKKPKIAKKR